MDTTGNTELSISRAVLLQCQKDGRGYKELIQRMATIILHDMKDDSLPDELEFIEWGSIHGMDSEDYKAIAKKIANHAGIAVYAEDEGKNTLVPGVGTVYVKQLKRYQFGE